MSEERRVLLEAADIIEKQPFLLKNGDYHDAIYSNHDFENKTAAITWCSCLDGAVIRAIRCAPLGPPTLLSEERKLYERCMLAVVKVLGLRHITEIHKWNDDVASQDDVATALRKAADVYKEAV